MLDFVTIYHEAADLTATVPETSIPTWEASGWTTEPPAIEPTKTTPKTPAKTGTKSATLAEKE